MNALELFLTDFKECRRRFLIVAESIPSEYLPWRPDTDALSIGDMIRHVLLHDLSWLTILKEGRLPTDEERGHLWATPVTSVQEEIQKADPFTKKFVEYIQELESETLESVQIKWPHRPIVRTLGDALERKTYHDAVHTGQLLQYMRMLQIKRPDIWD